MIRNLVRIRCCSVFSGVKLQRTNCQCRLPNVLCTRETDLRLLESNYNSQTANISFLTLLAPGRQIFGYLPTSGPFRKLNWLRFFLITSSLSPHLARLLARLGAFLSASCRLSLFPLERFGGLACWSSHWWCGIDCRRSCRWLVRVVFGERADKLSKVLDH